MGTYLTWGYCTAMGMTYEKLNTFMLKKAKMWIDEGTLFGLGGSMFIRLDLTCPKSILLRALDDRENSQGESEVRDLHLFS